MSLHLKHSNGLQLSTIAYYNSNRGASRGKELNCPTAGFSRLMDELINARFNVRTWWTSLPESSQQFAQLFFCTDSHINLARIYVSCAMMQIEATFKTNNLGMPLATHIGVTNTNRTFPFALSFVRSESKESFLFR
jgi:hypothetical protein